MGRGKTLSRDDVVVAKSAYDLLVQELGPGRPVGATQLMKKLPENFKRSSVTQLVKKFRDGKGVDEAHVPRVRTSTKVTAATAERVAKHIAKDNNTLKSSLREIARKEHMSKTSVQRVIKNQLKKKLVKRVRTTKNAPTTMAKRAAGTAKVVKMLDDGLDLATVWFSDETWVEGKDNGRYNSQNDKVYLDEGEKKEDHMDELMEPKVQRPIGRMVHLTCSAHNGGTILPPVIVPDGITVTSVYYCSMMESSVFPAIEAHMGTRPWVFMQDLASPHISKYTLGRFKDSGVKLLPWFPASADLNPLDVYLNDELKNKIKDSGLDISTKKALGTAVASVLGDMRADPEILKNVEKTCLAFGKRVRWVANNGGRKVIRSKVNKEAAEAAGEAAGAEEMAA